MVRGTGFGVYVVRDGDYAHGFVDADGTEIDQGVEQGDFEVVGPWRLGNGQHVAAGKVDVDNRVSILQRDCVWSPGENRLHSGTDFADPRRQADLI